MTKEKYMKLRSEVREFTPDAAQGDLCKDPLVQEAFRKIEERYDEILQGDSNYNMMNMRKKYYGFLPEMIPVKLFRNSPFYFSVGINGGWAYSPASSSFLYHKWIGDFYKREVPPEKLRLFHERGNGKFLLCCGPYVDQVHHLPPLTRILRAGFKGVREEAVSELEKCVLSAEREFLETAIAGLDSIHAIQLKFAAEAREKLQDPALTKEQKKFMEMAAISAEKCPWEAPRTFYEGLNTLLFVREIMAIADGLYIYALGRPDAMLYDLYQADLAAGRITKEEAYDLISRFLVICDSHYDGDRTVTAYGDHELEIPLTIGGCDEEGKAVYNELTRFIIRAHRENDLVFPKLHCRVSKDSPDEYIRELAEDTWNGRCVHTLFNDEALIPGLLKQGKTLSEARRFICAGCWNSVPDSVENMDDANYYSLARVLEAMIYQDEGQEERYGFHFDRIDQCTSFEELRELVISNIIRFLHLIMEDYTQYGKLFAKVSPHPAYSVCLEGCIQNRKDETQGGARFSSRLIVLAFLANVVDSLLAIDHICFRRKLCTLPAFLEIVRNNWEGAEELRQTAMKAPYWGDNSAASRELGTSILTKIRESSAHLRNERGGAYLYCLWIYREYRYWGQAMRALPDGRHTGDQLAQALNPSDFRNKEAITTTLNALSCLDYTDFASSNINMTFDKTASTPEVIFAFFRTFINNKVQLLQPNAFDKAELEDAMIHPEKHHNLIVKVCGFSARFVALEPAWQKIVISRRHY